MLMLSSQVSFGAFNCCLPWKKNSFLWYHLTMINVPCNVFCLNHYFITDACVFYTILKGWPVVACPFWALDVLYRMLTIFACYVLTFMFEMLFLFSTTSLGCFVHRFCFSKKGLNMLPWTSFTCNTKDNQQGCFRLSNWFSLRRLGPWMNHLPPAW